MSTQSEMQPRLTHIFISPQAGAYMQEVNEIDAFKGHGLVGDRYAEGTGFWQTLKKPRPAVRQVSLISQAAIDAAIEEAGRDFPLELSRRNLIIEGNIVDLRGLIGQEFRVGSVIMRGAEECTPCGRPQQVWGNDHTESVQGKKFEQVFIDGRGGLRAEILNNGRIFQGDWMSLPNNYVLKNGIYTYL